MTLNSADEYFSKLERETKHGAKWGAMGGAVIGGAKGAIQGSAYGGKVAAVDGVRGAVLGAAGSGLGGAAIGAGISHDRKKKNGAFKKNVDSSVIDEAREVSKGRGENTLTGAAVGGGVGAGAGFAAHKFGPDALRAGAKGLRSNFRKPGGFRAPGIEGAKQVTAGLKTANKLQEGGAALRGASRAGVIGAAAAGGAALAGGAAALHRPRS